MTVVHPESASSRTRELYAENNKDAIAAAIRDYHENESGVEDIIISSVEVWSVGLDPEPMERHKDVSVDIPLSELTNVTAGDVSEMDERV